MILNISSIITSFPYKPITKKTFIPQIHEYTKNTDKTAHPHITSYLRTENGCLDSSNEPSIHCGVPLLAKSPTISTLLHLFYFICGRIKRKHRFFSSLPVFGYVTRARYVSVFTRQLRKFNMCCTRF